MLVAAVDAHPRVYNCRISPRAPKRRRSAPLWRAWGCRAGWKRNSDTALGCSCIAPDRQQMRERFTFWTCEERARLLWSATLLAPRTFFARQGGVTMPTRARSGFNTAVDGVALGLAAIAVGMLAWWWWLSPL